MSESITEMRHKLMVSHNPEAVKLSHTLARLPPAFTDGDLRDVNNAYARGKRVLETMPDARERDISEV
jgi:hypothetical protein